MEIELLNSIPVWVREFGFLVVFAMLFVYLLAVSPFSGEIAGTYRFSITKNGKSKEVSIDSTSYNGEKALAKTPIGED